MVVDLSGRIADTNGEDSSFKATGGCARQIFRRYEHGELKKMVSVLLYYIADGDWSEQRRETSAFLCFRDQVEDAMKL